ncbi:restriction endonuclease subunit S [Pseudanabaena sp. SR411]|uniref:restriction endonuclease subunit S n=1 Tax=Pseudanabaena sp. SR411 TaxID=1980935 RepID=UPI001C3DD4BB|nr:restriction endonuclease subunit S [Pseudanabaena sp. SR411]
MTINTDAVALLEKNFDVAFAAPDGIKKLRELILSLAMQGKLVPQDEADQPARELLKEIAAEKGRLVKDGKIKASKPLPEIKPDEVPYDLPKGWEWVRLGTYCYIFSGNAFKSEDFNSIDGIKAIKITNAGVGELIETSDFLPERFSIEYSDYQVRENDLILALTRPYISSGLKISICPSSYHGSLLNQRVASIRPFQFFNFIFLFLSSPHVLSIYQKRFRDSGLQPNLKMSDVTDLLAPIPPLAEQRRIVAKIDELMARCDELERLKAERDRKQITVHKAALNRLLTAKDHSDFQTSWHFITQHFSELYSVKENVAELRKAILQIAVMGKLVPQDPNDQPASELLKEIEKEKKDLIKEGKIKVSKPLSEIKPDEVPYKLPKSWKWCRVWDIAQLITSGSRDWAKYYSDDGAIFVTMGNLSRGNYNLRMENMRYVKPPKDGEGARTKLEENDLLISITGDVGNLGLIPKEFGDAYINQHTCLLRFMPICRNRYFPELMRTSLAKSQFDAPQRGIKNSFRLGDVGEMTIPLPPLAEQHRIVAKIDRLMTLCDELEKQIDAAESKQTNLLNSMMAKV